VTDYVLTGLVKRRAAVAGEIEQTHEHLKKLLADLETLDAAILQFAPDYKIEAIKPKAFRPPPDWSHRGQMIRFVLNTLRQAAEPLTARDIALQLLVERALNRDDQKLLRLMTKRVGVALRGARDNSAVKSAQGPGQFMVWEIAR